MGRTFILIVLVSPLLNAEENFLEGVRAEDLSRDRIEQPSAEDTIGIGDWSRFFYNTSKSSSSADGNFSMEYGSQGIWVTNLISNEQMVIDERGFTPKWCPTSNVIAFLKMKVLEGKYYNGHQLYGEDELWICGPYGENKRKLTTHTQVGEFTWSPDGEFICFEGVDSTGYPDELYYIGVIDITTGQKSTIDVGAPYNDIPFCVSPNGEMIAYCKPLQWELRAEWWVTDAEIFIANIGGSGKIQITETEAVEVMVKWLSDGKSLVVEQHGSDPGDFSLPRYVKIVLKTKD
jgi:hypothetical protein